jgi:hypothetical protein
MANDEDYKVMIASCKECGKEFEMRIPIRIYEALVALAVEDGETPVFEVVARTAKSAIRS